MPPVQRFVARSRSTRFKLAVAGLVVGLMAFGPSRAEAATTAPTTAEYVAEFERWSGAKLVFTKAGLPSGHWYDRMPQLDSAGKRDAARIALREVQRLPQGYLAAVGLKSLGIFEACISNSGDGFRPYNKQLKGYVYFGVYQKRALAAAYYNDTQLPLTLHHEIYHHIDSTIGGKTAHGVYFPLDDARFAAAVSLKKPYPALKLSASQLGALKKAAQGHVLRNAVGSYSTKSPGEDQAETARYMMSHLPDALLQAATQPKLPGSQRILHVLEGYRQAAAAGKGPGAAWFVGAATGADPYLAELKAAMDAGRSDAVRAARDRALRFGRTSAALTKAQAEASLWLVSRRVQPGGNAFAIFGREDVDGVNWTLRADLATHGSDLAVAGSVASSGDAPVARFAARKVLGGVRLLARFHQWIASNWSVTKGTRQAFESSIKRATASLSGPRHLAARSHLQRARIEDIPTLIDDQGDFVPPRPAPTAHKQAKVRRTNKYMGNVDKAIKDPALRGAIRAVQPSTVRVASGGSGVNIHPSGLILTNAHVLDALGRQTSVTFPDGQRFRVKTTFIDHKLDVAIAMVMKKGTTGLPSAPLAARAPVKGTRVVVIGQPGRHTPDGELTGYGAFHVSVGEIRGFLKNRLGNQSLGATKHDAWTYWGHSGSPLFDSQGRIVAMHNSWDSKTAMRHAVPWEAITHALKRWKVPFTTAP